MHHHKENIKSSIWATLAESSGIIVYNKAKLFYYLADQKPFQSINIDRLYTLFDIGLQEMVEAGTLTIDAEGVISLNQAD